MYQGSIEVGEEGEATTEADTGVESGVEGDTVPTEDVAGTWWRVVIHMSINLMSTVGEDVVTKSWRFKNPVVPRVIHPFLMISLLLFILWASNCHLSVLIPGNCRRFSHAHKLKFDPHHSFAMFARSFLTVLDACAWRAASSRSLTTSIRPYPYSQVAIIPPAPAGSPPATLREGKNLMAYLQQTLPSTEKQTLIGTLFSRSHPDRVRPGSVLTVNLTHAPTTFSGVLISVRRRGPDTSFVLRNVVQRTGVEMQFFVNSPHVKEIVVVSRAGGRGGSRGAADDGKGKKRKGMKKAKLFYLRDSPEKMTAVSAGVR